MSKAYIVKLANFKTFHFESVIEMDSFLDNIPSCQVVNIKTIYVDQMLRNGLIKQGLMQ